MDALPSQRSGSAEGVGALPAVPNPTANRWWLNLRLAQIFFCYTTLGLCLKYSAVILPIVLQILESMMAWELGKQLLVHFLLIHVFCEIWVSRIHRVCLRSYWLTWNFTLRRKFYKRWKLSWEPVELPPTERESEHWKGIWCLYFEDDYVVSHSFPHVQSIECYELK